GHFPSKNCKNFSRISLPVKANPRFPGLANERPGEICRPLDQGIMAEGKSARQHKGMDIQEGASFFGGLDETIRPKPIRAQRKYRSLSESLKSPNRAADHIFLSYFGSQTETWSRGFAEARWAASAETTSTWSLYCRPASA